VGVIQGKVSELEEYYKNPDKWFSEKVEKFLEKRIRAMEKNLGELDGFVKKSRDYNKQDFLQTLIVSKLTEIANSETWESVVVNLRALEFIAAEMKRGGYWTPPIRNSVIESLAGTRDFWEGKAPEVSEALQEGIDRIEKR
jgi:hypothetical protein